MEDLQVLPKYINDQFLKESEILKSWNLRQIVLNSMTRTLQILGKEGRSNKILELNQYTVEILEKSKENKNLVLFLRAIDERNKSLKYKQIKLSDPNNEKIQQWYNFIQRLIKGDFVLESKQKNDNQITQQKQQQQSSSITITFQQQKLSIDNQDETKLENGNEKEIYECQMLPYISYMPKAMMPYSSSNGISLNRVKSYDQKPLIQKYIKKAPSMFSEKIKEQLEWCFRTHGQDFFANTSQDFLFIKKKINNTVYQSKQNKNQFRGILVCQNSPRELYETILLPYKEHWHPSIQQFSIFPNEEDDSAIIINVLNFQKDQCTFVDKKVVYYRYGFSYLNFYFVVCESQYNIQEDAEINKVSIVHKIFSDPTDEKQTLFTTDLIFDFQNESQTDIKRNVIKYLLNIMYIDHISPEINDQKLIIEQYSNKKKKNEDDDQNQLMDQVEEEEKNIIKDINNNSNDEDNISIDVKYEIETNKKLKNTNSRPPWIPDNYEEEQSKEILLNLLQDVEKKQPTERAIRNMHIMTYFEPLEKNNRLKSTKDKGHYCYKYDYVRNEKTGGLNFMNQALIKEQRTVIFSLLQRVGSNILSGKSIMSISMPVTIFDPKSYLQRIARSYGHAPNFLYKAGLQTDVVEQIKYCAAFNCGAFIMQLNQEKPFNPILGETLQGRLNGYPIYMEQVAHHPPITNFLHHGPNYKLYGQSSCEVNMGANSVSGHQKGQPTILIENTKTIIKIIQQPFTVYNSAIGNRSFNCQGRCFVYAPQQRIVCEIIYNPNDKGPISNFFSSSNYKIDEIAGSIFRVKQNIIDQLDEIHKCCSQTNQKKTLQINPQKDVEAYFSKIDGYWNSVLRFDGEVYWDDSVDFPYVLEYEPNPLFSDSMFRPDLIWLNINDKNKSQEEKETLEALQRNDAKLRKDYQEKKQKQQKK